MKNKQEKYINPPKRKEENEQLIQKPDAPRRTQSKRNYCIYLYSFRFFTFLFIFFFFEALFFGYSTQNLHFLYDIQNNSKIKLKDLKPSVFNVLFIFGTRPECIKLMPLFLELSRDPSFHVEILYLNQHEHLILDCTSIFKVDFDYIIDIFEPRQSILSLTRKAQSRDVEPLISRKNLNLVVIQGDTTLAKNIAEVSFHLSVPIAHVEAGLRTYDLQSPYPEEFNRQFISSVATYNFAPTLYAKQNLLYERVPISRIWVTGNTGIDAIDLIVPQLDTSWTPHQHFKFSDKHDIVFLTMHRREKSRKDVLNIFEAMTQILQAHENSVIIYSVHPSLFERINSDDTPKHPRFIQTPHLMYNYTLALMNFSRVLITDSGGLQEEATYFGLPTLITRNRSDRMKSILSKNAVLLSSETKDIVFYTRSLLRNDKNLYTIMSKRNFPFGDGSASNKIKQIIKDNPLLQPLGKSRPNVFEQVYQRNPWNEDTFVIEDYSQCPKKSCPTDETTQCECSADTIFQPSTTPDFHRTDGKLTVVLNIYQRHTCYEQIDALRKSTFPIHRVIVWQNGHFTDCDGVIEKEVHGKSVEIIKSSINWKFLGRFSVALMVDTEYTIVLDDDMSPGAKWFENSIRVIGQYNALATGNGRIVRNVDEYNHAALGETSKNDHDILVDYGGHSWGFRTEWISLLWGEPDLFLDTAEDMQISSYFWLKKKIRTVVPKQDRSIGTAAHSADLKHGQKSDSFASFKNTKGERRVLIMKELIKRGYVLLRNRSPKEQDLTEDIL